MLIRFMKRKIGDSHLLVCIREDGSAAWQKSFQSFFIEHDLMHYSVETILELKDAFFGMVEQGYDLDDFGKKNSATGAKP